MNTDFNTDEAIREREELEELWEELKNRFYEVCGVSFSDKYQGYSMAYNSLTDKIFRAKYDLYNINIPVATETSIELNKFLGGFKIIEGGAAL